MHRSRRLLNVPLATLSVLFASVFLFGGVVHAQEIKPLSVNEQIIQEQSQKVEEKAAILENESKEVESLELQKNTLADQLSAEQKKIAELKQKIADKKAAEERAKAASVQAVATYTAPVVSGQGLMSGCGDNYYAAYIYGMESGGQVVGMCNPSAQNAGGCRGIGQACPGGKLPCGADYACQNAYFNNYALSVYKSWAAAYNFHRANGWW